MRTHPGSPPPTSSGGSAHFLAEDARVPLAAEAFRRRDQDALGELSAASQHDAEALLGNQIPETSALAALARESGAFAASSFGAGFGGSVWALVEAADAVSFAERWRRRYRAAWPAVADGACFIARPGPRRPKSPSANRDGPLQGGRVRQVVIVKSADPREHEVRRFAGLARRQHTDLIHIDAVGRGRGAGPTSCCDSGCRC